MPLLPSVLAESLEKALATPILAAAPLSGGDINRVCHLRTAQGDYCLKYNEAGRYPGLFEREAEGLAALGAAAALPVPAVLGRGEAGPHSYLLLAFVPGAAPGPQFWERFGRGLAALHRQSAPRFGFPHDNYIGTLPQPNAWADTWAGFYATQRLWPQARRAEAAGLLGPAELAALARLCERLPALCPAEPPALIHGDLWSGNYLAARTARC